MVFSAPEMTTVSKPKRNPASADVSDQKKTRAFIEGRNLMSASHDKRIVDATQMLGVRPGVRATSCELKPPRLTVYKDIGRELQKRLEEMCSQLVKMQNRIAELEAPLPLLIWTSASPMHPSPGASRESQALPSNTLHIPWRFHRPCLFR